MGRTCPHYGWVQVARRLVFVLATPTRNIYHSMSPEEGPQWQFQAVKGRSSTSIASRDQIYGLRAGRTPLKAGHLAHQEKFRHHRVETTVIYLFMELTSHLIPGLVLSRWHQRLHCIVYIFSDSTTTMIPYIKHLTHTLNVASDVFYSPLFSQRTIQSRP